MIVVCSYCRKYLRGEEENDGKLSHGICPDCVNYYKPQFLGLKVDEYLDKYPLPIAIVNPEGRILIANEQARQMVSKDETNYGFLGGEFMECVYARLPEGCGNTVHCSSCTIRGAVNMAMAGEDQISVPAYLEQEDKRINMLISTQKIEGKLVVLTIEEVTGVELH